MRSAQPPKVIEVAMPPSRPGTVGRHRGWRGGRRPCLQSQVRRRPGHSLYRRTPGPFFAFCSTIKMVLPSVSAGDRSRISKTMSINRGSKPIDGSSTKKDVRVHDQCSGDLEKAPFATGEDLGLVLSAISARRGYLSNTRSAACLALAGSSMRIATHPEIFLDRHPGEDRLVLENIGDTCRLSASGLSSRRRHSRCSLP